MENNPKYIQLKERYHVLKEKLKDKERDIYFSILSSTREGGTNPFMRLMDDGSQPVRVPVSIKESVNYDAILLYELEREKRHIYAEEYRKKRYACIKTRWK